MKHGEDDDMPGDLQSLLDYMNRSAGSAQIQDFYLQLLLDKVGDLDSPEETEHLLYTADILAGRRLMNSRDAVERIAVPLADQVEDEELMRIIVNGIVLNAQAAHEDGYVLGSRPVDHQTFEALALLFRKLARGEQLSEGLQTDQTKVRQIAGELSALLLENPQNDRELIALIEPFTKADAAPGQHRRIHKAPRLRQ